MRSVVTALAVMACAALTVGAADDEKYASKDGKFAIQFPKDAKVKIETKKAGELDMIFAKVVEAEDKEFIVMYMDLPAAANGVPTKTIFDSGEKGGVQASGGKLESSKDITFSKNKLPGREFVVSKDDFKTTNRIILDGSRLYVLTVAGRKDFATSKDAIKFLDSFEITK